MKGRRSKPTLLHKLAGTRPEKPRQAEPLPRPGDPGPGPAPGYFTEQQAALWRRVLADAPAGLFAAVDCGVLEVFVVAADQARQAAAQLAREGSVVTNDRGIVVEHPASRIFCRASGLVLKAAAALGLDPTSRCRISIEPAETEENPFAQFGRARRLSASKPN